SELRKIGDLKVHVRTEDFSALSLGEQFLQVRLAPQLVNVDLAHPVQVGLDAFPASVVVPAHLECPCVCVSAACPPVSGAHECSVWISAPSIRQSRCSCRPTLSMSLIRATKSDPKTTGAPNCS